MGVKSQCGRGEGCEPCRSHVPSLAPLLRRRSPRSARRCGGRCARWRVAFLLISGVGALVEERGLGKGILNNPDMRPQVDTSKTRFDDVKGVDEAKVGAAIAPQL